MAKAHPTRTDLTAEYVRSRLDYDPDTGVLRWKTREDLPAGRTRNVWNGRYAGKVAGCVNTHGHVVIAIDSRLYYAHRLAWLIVYGEWPDDQLDHANMEHADNRLANLREATHGQNQRNRRALRGSATGLKGVSEDKRSGRFTARISHDDRVRHLGTFDTPEAAHDAYRAAAEKLHGEYSRAE